MAEYISDSESELMIEEDSKNEEKIFEDIKEKLTNKLQPSNKLNLINFVQQFSKDATKYDRKKFFDKGVGFLRENVADAMKNASSISDFYFILNVSREIFNILQAKLEDDPCPYEWIDLFEVDGKTVESWCPGGLDQLKSMSNKMLITDHSSFKNDSIHNEPIMNEKIRREPQLFTQCEVKVDQTKKSESNIKTNLRKMLNILIDYKQNKKRVHFFEFLLNPRSFVQSLYNIHLMSFLVSERYVKMYFGENNSLLIRPRTCGESFNSSQTANTNNHQTARHSSFKKPGKHLVISIDYRQWEALRKNLNLTESVLPEFLPKQVGTCIYEFNQTEQDLKQVGTCIYEFNQTEQDLKNLFHKS